jgi:hypothetical protein
VNTVKRFNLHPLAATEIDHLLNWPHQGSPDPEVQVCKDREPNSVELFCNFTGCSNEGHQVALTLYSLRGALRLYTESCVPGRTAYMHLHLAADHIGAAMQSIAEREAEIERQRQEARQEWSL